MSRAIHGSVIGYGYAEQNRLGNATDGYLHSTGRAVLTGRSSKSYKQLQSEVKKGSQPRLTFLSASYVLESDVNGFAP